MVSYSRSRRITVFLDPGTVFFIRTRRAAKLRHSLSIPYFLFFRNVRLYPVRYATQNNAGTPTTIAIASRTAPTFILSSFLF